MKKVILLSAAAVILAAGPVLQDCRAEAEEAKPSADSGAAAQPRGRPVVSLAGEWVYQFVSEPAATPEGPWQQEIRKGSRKEPVVLPGPIRLTGKSVCGVWFQRQATIPGDWQGRRIVLRIGRCLFGVAIHIDGRKAGELPGYGGELDVTSFFEPGKTATVRLYCGSLGKGLESLDRVTQSAADYIKNNRAWLAANVGIFGTDEELCLESQAPDLQVSDVWYQTTVRGGERIEPLITIDSSSPRDGLSGLVRIFEADSGKPVLEKTFSLGRLPAGRSEHRTLLSARNLKLWNIRNPNLYLGQVLILEGSGKELDRSNPERFGVREFWAQGRYLYLNNYIVCPVPAFCYKPESLDELVAAGITMVQDSFPFWFRFHEARRQKALAAACDERGVLFSATGMTHHHLNLVDADTLKDYITWARHYYRRYRNHPSIVIYGLGINAPGNFNDFSPAKLGRTSNVIWANPGTTRSYLVGREMDPTRLFYFHGGACGGDIGSANFYPNHMPVQELEDWMLEWSQKGDRPFLTVEGLLGQFDVDYDKGGVVYVTEYLSRLAGEDAYRAENDDYRDYIAYTRPRMPWTPWGLKVGKHPMLEPQRAQYLKRAGRAWRHLRIPFHHWAGTIGGATAPAKVETEFVQAAQNLRRPAMAWIGGPEEDFSLKDHNFYGGQTVQKTLLGISERLDPITWQAAWELRQRPTGKVAASGRFTRKMGPFSRARIPFGFRLPEVRKATDYELVLNVKEKDSGKLVDENRFSITAYPDRTFHTGRKSRPLMVFDPKGETTAWLESLGVSCEPWKAEASSPGRVLVIGREALRGLKQLPFSADDVDAGLRVVVFEQHCRELGNLGFRHEDRSPRQVFVRLGDHPLAANLNRELLRDWRGHATLISPGPEGDRLAVSTRSFRAGNRGSVASVIFETPHFGPFETILDCEFDLSYSPLMRWPHGRGEIVYCQLDLTDRVGREPGADIVADNLLRYLDTPLAPRTGKTAVCLDGETAQEIQGFGFAASMAPGQPSPEKHVLVIRAGQAALLADRRDNVKAFLEGGGEMLVLYADADLLADPLFGDRLHTNTSRVPHGTIDAGSHPLVRGMGPQNLHWRATVDLVKVGSQDEDFVSLMEGLAGVLPHGKGRIVLFQVDPKRMADVKAAKELDPLTKLADPKEVKKPLSNHSLQKHRRRTQWHARRLHSLLMANLSLRSSEALTRRLFEIKPTMTKIAVNEWMVLGPFPPSDNTQEIGHLERESLQEFAAQRDLSFEGVNSEGAKVRWFAPNDMMHGLGQDGKNNLGLVYGVKEGLTSIAVTYLWSTREREAVIGHGADWWLRMQVNGKEVFKTQRKPWTFGINFDRKTRVRLKAGWNEIVLFLAAGSNGNIFWFQIDNPGDVVVARQLAAPAEAPAGLPPLEELIPDGIDPGFQLYAEPMLGQYDPYSYHPW